LKDKDYIKDLFSEKLSNHEVPVRSDLWSGIQSQLGNTAASTVVAKGISSSLKWMIGIASTVVMFGTAVWISSNKTEVNPNKVEITQNSAKETKTEEKTTETKVSISSIKENTEKTNNQAIVPQAEIPKFIYLNERISGERQLKVLDHLGNSVLQPKDETILNPIITESSFDESRPTNVVSTPKPHDVKLFEDGKIEEFVNVFTPNGDGMNDVFFLNAENLKDFTIRIFNEKDQLVFQSTDKDFKWFGLDASGVMVDAGNYGYVIFATDFNGKSIKMFKSLTIR